MFELEYTTAQDLFYDFCLWEYQPVSPPNDKLSSSTLLFHSFEFTGLSDRVWDLVRAIRKGFGVSRTVWGLKKPGTDIRWEFYFYDYKRKERERSITRLLDLLRPFVPCEIQANENLSYFMFSVDIDDALVSGRRALDEIHMYIGNPGSSVSSGICYSLTKLGNRLENFCFFFDAKKEWNDAVYFSRINVDQLIFFMRRMGHPRELVSFVEQNRSKLDHLLYDAGFDYRMEGKDLRILKSGYYGIF